jgi:hypothetical protein
LLRVKSVLHQGYSALQKRPEWRSETVAPGTSIYAFPRTLCIMTIEEDVDVHVDVDGDTPCPTQREGNLSNELRRMILSQQSHPQVVAPPPMFNDCSKASSNENMDPKAGNPRAAPTAPLFSFSTASQLTQGRNKTQNASQFLTSQDFVTPADQFDAEYDVMNCSQRAAGTLVRQRSPAAMSPMRMKRVNRMASPGRSVLGKGAMGAMAAAGAAGAVGIAGAVVLGLLGLLGLPGLRSRGALRRVIGALSRIGWRKSVGWRGGWSREMRE